jgi:hypothetical protein
MATRRHRLAIITSTHSCTPVPKSTQVFVPTEEEKARFGLDQQHMSTIREPLEDSHN